MSSRNYLPLATHLQGQPATVSQVRLSFADIEKLIGSTLPPSARTYQAWWANSRSNDSHSWAHLWLRAGWERREYSISKQWVEFGRTQHYELDDPKAMEGYEYDARVLLRSRNFALACARKQKDGYTCQACSFHLRVGDSYVIEVHHTDPLAARAERETTIHDLVSLCPTCHRIAHLRTRPYSVDEIRKLRHTAKRPNKAPEPTTFAVTSRAMVRLVEGRARTVRRIAARAAPAKVVAHL
jgi:hypothetical protein